MLGQRAELGSTEQKVLLEAGTAYMDVIRDRAVLKLNKSNERVLRRRLTRALQSLKYDGATPQVESDGEERNRDAIEEDGIPVKQLEQSHPSVPPCR